VSDEDFKQTMIDYLGIELQRNERIMATLADVQANHAAMKTELESLKIDVHKALADLTATGAAGHAAVLDVIVADQASMLTIMKDTNGEIKSAIAAVPVPGATPGPQ
jgi:hypothetical protein